MDSGDVAVGVRINAVRAHNQLSSKDFAASLNISPSALYNYERGVRNISAALLVEIARKYRIDPFWIMDGPEPAPRDLRRPGVELQTLRMAYDVVSSLLHDSEVIVSDEKVCELLFKAYVRFDEKLNPVPADFYSDDLGRIA